MTRRPRGTGAWAIIGATAGALVGGAWAYFGSGSDSYEWMDIAIVLGPIGLLLGALAGVVIGAFRR
jgi:hypothetical protein